ncbi:MAG: hypothetical protein II937_09635 [Bacteroidales bacterium]|nr:hypothetical protein [Bacteroidales bacterium]
MTRTEFRHIANTKGFDEAMSRLSEDAITLHDEETLILFIKQKLDKVDYPLAAHILNCIVESKGDSRWYDYDFDCGMLDKPVCINTVEEALTFDYFDV